MYKMYKYNLHYPNRTFKGKLLKPTCCFILLIHYKQYRVGQFCDFDGYEFITNMMVTDVKDTFVFVTLLYDKYVHICHMCENCFIVILTCFSTQCFRDRHFDMYIPFLRLHVISGLN